jgi:hypothetical protein
MENIKNAAKSNDLIISKEVDSKKQQNQTTYDPDDYLYKYYYETLLHDDICLSCKYRIRSHCTSPNGYCNYIPLDNIKKD